MTTEGTLARGDFLIKPMCPRDCYKEIRKETKHARTAVKQALAHSQEQIWKLDYTQLLAGNEQDLMDYENAVREIERLKSVEKLLH